MTREQIIFDINYSHYVEKTFSIVMSRIDKLISVVLMILGLALFAPFNNNFAFGLLVAVLSAVQFTYQFGKQAGISQNQAQKYLTLMTEESRFKDEDLLINLVELQKNDSSVWGVCESIAYKKAALKLGLVDETPDLSTQEKLFAVISGGIPKV